MSKVTVYSMGPLSCSVCAPNDMTPKEVEADVNLNNPSGTMNGWKISTDSHFRQGKPNPCPCDQDPENRRHFLMDC